MDRAIYLYDDSFEGMLSALAMAVKSGRGEVSVKAAGVYRPDLFTKVVQVQTDRAQARRLYAYLLQVGGAAPQLAMDGFLSEDPEAAGYLVLLLRRLLAQGEGVLHDWTDAAVHALLLLSRRVRKEAHRFTGLLRFRLLDDGLLYGPFSPDHNVLGYVSRHFRQRFGTRPWVLHDVRRNLGAHWDGERLEEIQIAMEFTHLIREHGEVPEAMLAAHELHYQQLWRSFHRAIANKARENHVLQRHHMPHRYWRYLPEVNAGPESVTLAGEQRLVRPR